MKAFTQSILLPMEKPVGQQERLAESVSGVDESLLISSSAGYFDKSIGSLSRSAQPPICTEVTSRGDNVLTCE